MFDFPGVIDSEAICKFDLIERILKELKLVAVMPGPRELMLVEDSEFHGPLVYLLSCGLAFSASLWAAVSNAAMMFLKRVSTNSFISGCVKM